MVVLIITVSSCATQKAIKEVEESPLKTVSQSSLKLTITNVSLDKKIFNPSKDEVVKIRYRLSKQGLVTIKIYDSDDNLVRILEPAEVDKQGYNEKTWDGKDNRNNILPDEAYIYTIEGKDISNNEKFRYDISDETGGIELTLRELNFNKETGEIDYLLPKAARVRIRIGITEGGPLLRTLLNWEPQKAGKHSLKWDGMDSSGIMSLLGKENIFGNIANFSLPENSVLLEGGDNKIYTPMGTGLKIEGVEKRPKKKTNIKKCIHALHKRAKCHEPNFDFEILDIEEYDNKNIPLIKGDVVPIRVVLDEEDKLDLINSRFEIIFFIDNVFVFEEEEGTSPFTYKFDAKGLNEGEHIITVNIYGYDDHISSRSKRIFIQRKEKNRQD